MENPLYFYKIKIPFNDSNFQTIYFTEKTISIKHQLKYYKFKNLILLQDYFNPFLIPELKKEAILQSSLNDLIFFPNLKEMSIEEILEIKKFIEFKPFIHNFYYIKAKLSEIDGNFKEALEFYKKGKDNNDYFCIINLIRIYCENELSIKYQIEQNFSASINLMQETLESYGLFNIFVPGNFEISSIIYLLYIYCDCFPLFFELIQIELESNLILQILFHEDFNSPNTFHFKQILKENEEKNSLILADLMHSYFLGISPIINFEERLYFYKKHTNSQKGYISWARILNMVSEILENSEDLTPEIISIIKNISENASLFLNSNKLTLYCYENLHYLTNFSLFIQKITFSSKILRHCQTLSIFGYKEILFDYFKFLKYLIKSQPKEFIHENSKLYKISKKLSVSKFNQFSEGPLAYCLEKGRGCEQDLFSSINIYIELLKKTISNRSEIYFFCYRLASCLDKNKEFSSQSEILFEIGYYSIIINFQKKKLNILSLYDLAKLYFKGIIVEKNIKKALEFYNLINKYFENQNARNINEIIIKEKCLEKLKKYVGHTFDEIDFFETVNKEIILFEKNLLNLKISNFVKNKNLMKFFVGLINDISEMVKKVFKKMHKTSKNSNFNKDFDVLNPATPLFQPRKSYCFLRNDEEFLEFYKLKFKKSTNVFNFQEISILWDRKHVIELNKSIHLEFFEGLLLQNKQKIILNIMKFERSDKEIHKILSKILYFSRLNTSYFLRIIGICLNFNEDFLLINIIYEQFSLINFENDSEQMIFSLFSQITKIIKNINNSNMLITAFTLKNFVVCGKIIKFYDPTFDLLYINKKNSFNEENNKIMILSIANEFVAPEIIYSSFKSQKCFFSIGTIIWNLGILFVNLWTKKKFTKKFTERGFPALNYDEFCNVYLQKNIDLILENLITNIDILNFSKKLININQKNRNNISFKEIKEFIKDKTEIKIIKNQRKSLYNILFFQFTNTNQENLKELFLAKGYFFKGERKFNIPNGLGILKNYRNEYKGFFKEGFLHFKGILIRKTTSYTLILDGIYNMNTLVSGIFKKQTKSKEEIFIFDFKNFVLNASKIENDNDIHLNLELITKYNEIEKTEQKNKIKTIHFLDCFLLLIINPEEIYIFKNINIFEGYTLIYNKNIFNDKIYFFNNFSIGFFAIQIELLNPNKILEYLHNNNLDGYIMYFFGIFEIGIFKNFHLKTGKIIEFAPDFKILSKKIINGEKFDFQNFQYNENFNGNFNKKIGFYGKSDYVKKNFTFEGNLFGNKLEGKGIIKEKNKKKLLFSGFFKENLPSWGKFLINSCDYIEGNYELVDDLVIAKGNLIIKKYYLQKIKEIIGNFPLKKTFIINGFYSLIYENSSSYKGLLINLERKGKGKLQIGEKISIDGDWNSNFVKGRVEYKNNKMKTCNGNFEIINNEKINMLDGLIFIKFLNGSNFEGKIENGKYNGFGILSKRKENVKTVYIGEFTNNLKHGYGKELIFLRNGVNFLYQGYFSNGKKYGFSKIFKNNNIIFEGIFNINCSFGINYIYDENIEKIIGSFFINKRNYKINYISSGQIFFKNGQIYEGILNNIMESNLNNAFYLGSIKFNGNEIYEGEIQNLIFEGLGFLKKNNSIVYEGEFKNNKFDGLGFLYEKFDKNIYDFKNGKPIFYNNLKSFRTCIWKNELRFIMVKDKQKIYFEKRLNRKFIINYN